MTFGEKLREGRKAAKMTQEQLANILSVSRQAITKWEGDKGIPDVENLKLISQALSVSIDYLLDDGNKLDMSVIREPINLDDYKSLNATGKNRLFKADKLRDEVVRAKFPSADIYALFHQQIRTKKERRIDMFLQFVPLSAFGARRPFPDRHCRDDDKGARPVSEQTHRIQ